MIRKIYKLSTFNKSAALQESLCVVIKTTAVITNNIISNINVDSQTKIGTLNTDFIGTGICSYSSTNKIIITIEGITYKFDILGEGLKGTNSENYVLKTATVVEELSTAGNAIKSGSNTTVTIGSRSDPNSTSTVTKYEQTTKIIESLNARDEFAIHVLRELLSHIPNPSILSNSEMDFYCNTAYQWAANMMSSSANARSDYENSSDESSDGSSSTTGIPSRADITESALTTNTEKLLNNIIVALEKTNSAYKEGNKLTYYENVNIKFTELMDFLKTYIKKDATTNVGLKDLIDAISKIKLEGSTGSTSVDFSTLIAAIKETRNISFSTSSIGGSNKNPLYISGGAFPSKQVLSSSFVADSSDDNKICDLVSFNKNGAVGYSSVSEVSKAVVNNEDAQKSLIASSIIKAGIEGIVDFKLSDIQTLLDKRIQYWLNKATVTIDGKSYNIVITNLAPIEL